MKNRWMFLTLTLIACIIYSHSLQAQTGFEDVVYLKNGSIIRGTIMEMVPNVSVKIRTADNNLFFFKMEEIEKITKEAVRQQEKPAVSDGQEPLLLEGVDCYKGSYKLSKEAVSQILMDSDNNLAYVYWNDGQAKLKTGRILMGVGSGFMLLGVAASIGFAIDGATPPFIIMCVATPIGVGLTAGGGAAFNSGKRTLRLSISTYNSSLKTSINHSKVSLNMCFTTTMPGVGVQINF